MDFRERDSRSIWRSKLRLVIDFCWLGQGCFLSEKYPSRFVFEILYLPRLPTWQTRKQRSAFSKNLSDRVCG